VPDGLVYFPDWAVEEEAAAEPACVDEKEDARVGYVEVDELIEVVIVAGLGVVGVAGRYGHAGQ